MAGAILGIALATILAQDVSATAQARLSALANDFGIQIEVVSAPMKIERRGWHGTLQPPTREEIEAYSVLLDREWRRYPRTLMVRSRMAKILIGRDVKVLDQPRAAVPDFDPGWYWLDAKFSGQYAIHVLHHDFFHILDHWDSPDRREDKSWAALNPPEVRYGKGGWFMQTPNVGALREDLPGFLNQYATSAVEEDKAEVFAYLLTNTPFVQKRIDVDPVLSKKVLRLKELVREFEPSMAEAWWLGNASGNKP